MCDAAHPHCPVEQRGKHVKAYKQGEQHEWRSLFFLACEHAKATCVSGPTFTTTPFVIELSGLIATSDMRVLSPVAPCALGVTCASISPRRTRTRGSMNAGLQGRAPDVRLLLPPLFFDLSSRDPFFAPKLGTKGLLKREVLQDQFGNPFTETENTYVVRDEANGQP